MPEAPQELSLSQARSMQIPHRWPLVNTLDSRDGSFFKDARLVNAYAEKNKLTNEYEIEKRPGFNPVPIVSSFIEPRGHGLPPVPSSSAVGQGLFTYEYVQLFGSAPYVGKNYLTLFIASGGVYFILTDSLGGTSGITYLTTPTVSYATGNRFQFLGIPTSPPTIMFGGDNTTAASSSRVYVFQNGNVITLVGGDSSGFPSNTVPGFVYLNGYVYAMDYSGKIWETTNQNQVTGVGSWSPLDFITAASDADVAVQLARQLVYVVAIKTWTTQFYYDAGNSFGSSLSPLPGALYNFGCISADTFCDLDGVLFWATQSKVGTSRVVMVENLNAKFISTPAIERALDLDQGGSFYSLAYQHAGHRFYVLTNVTTNVTMVYDISEQLWYLWTDYNGNYYPVVARAGPASIEWHQMVSGNIYQMQPDYVYPNDFGNLVPVDIYTPNFDAGVDREKFLSQMRFNADQTRGSKLKIRSSDDDYQSWTNPRSIDLSIKRPILNDEGSFYRRAYHLRHFANTALRIKSIDLQMDIGVL